MNIPSGFFCRKIWPTWHNNRLKRFFIDQLIYLQPVYYLPLNYKKRIQTICIAAIGLACIQTTAQDVNIPDTSFKKKLIAIDGLDANADQEIQKSEAMPLKKIEVKWDTTVRSLEGIEEFENLEYLGDKECTS